MARQVKKKKYHHGNLRPALIKAALALVSKRGPKGLTLREAARRAGVTHAAPYRHFTDKAALLAAVAEEGFRTLASEIKGAIAANQDSQVSALQAIGWVYVRFASEHAAHFRVMYGPEAPPDGAMNESLRESANATFQLFVEAIEAAQAAGVLRADRTARDVALVTWSAMHGLAALLVSGRLASAGFDSGKPEELTRSVQMMVALGIAPRQ